MSVHNDADTVSTSASTSPPVRRGTHRAFGLLRLVRILLWAPWVTTAIRPSIMSSTLIHPPPLSSPLSVRDTFGARQIHIVGILLAGFAVFAGFVLEAVHRQALKTSDVGKRVRCRALGGFVWHGAKSMKVWTGFDCIEFVVLSASCFFNEQPRNWEFPRAIPWMSLIFVGIGFFMLVIKQIMAAISYTRGDGLAEWAFGTAVPLLGKSFCFMLVLLTAYVHALFAHPIPAWLYTDLRKAFGEDLVPSNISALTCNDEAAFHVAFMPVLEVDEPQCSLEESHCGYRSWRDLCHAWRVMPLQASSQDLVSNMALDILFLAVIFLGLASNARFTPTSDGIDLRRLAAPHIVLIIGISLFVCLLNLFDLGKLLVQLPLLMSGQPSANLHAVGGLSWAGRAPPELGLILCVVAIALLPIDTLNRILTSRSHRGRSYFLSYKQDDKNDGAVTMLHSLLPGTVWLDKYADDRSERGMMAGVAQSDVFVAVVSPQYFSSYFCCLELHTALTLRKPILVVWNQSKHTVQAALGWIQEVPQLHFLLENELLPIQEDVQMARTCAERIAAANVEPWVAAGELNWQTVEVPTVIGKHDFRNREDLAPELGLLAA